MGEWLLRKLFLGPEWSRSADEEYEEKSAVCYCKKVSKESTEQTLYMWKSENELQRLRLLIRKRSLRKRLILVW